MNVCVCVKQQLEKVHEFERENKVCVYVEGRISKGKMEIIFCFQKEKILYK